MAIMDEVLQEGDSKSTRFFDIPNGVREEFPFLEEPNASDIRIIARQLGRKPIGVVFVAARCVHSRPCVILTIPLEKRGKRIVPPLWLTCPAACKTAASLESSGEIRKLACTLRRRFETRQAFLKEEKRFSRLCKKIYSLCVEEKTLLKLSERGIAWGKPGSVKCLHAHLAYMIATGSFPGSWVGAGRRFEGKATFLCPDDQNMASGTHNGREGELRKGIIGFLCMPEIMNSGGIDCARPPDNCLG